MFYCFFFNQKPAYELRISDWSSDGCSSDLGAEGIRLAIDAGADSIEHGTILDEPTIAAWAKSKTYYVPTLSTVNGYKERLAANPDAYEPDVLAKIKWRISITRKSLETLVPRGVRIAFGTQAGVSKHSSDTPAGGKECVSTCRSRRSPNH